MSDTSVAASSPPIASRTRPRFTLTRPMFPEGIVTPVLLVALVTVAGLSVESSDWARIVTPVALVAAASALFGSVVAKLRVLDSLAHLLSIGLAFGVSVALVATQATSIEGGIRDRIREIGLVGLDWYLGDPIDEEMESLLVSLLMGIIVWLVGYLAAWSLFRRGWLLSAILLPGFLILVNLGYADDPDTGYLAAFAFLALVLAARHNLYARQREWRRARLTGPAGLGHRFLAAGVVVALVATAIGWRSPSSLSQATLQPLVGEVADRAVSLQDRATSWLDEASGNTSGKVTVSGEFSAFGESFAIGGPLELTDQPQALVFADAPPYLTAQHYDSYTGRGWYSTTEDTFNPVGEDGRRYSPAMTFGVDQEVPLTNSVTSGRTPTSVEITPLVPMGDRVLTVDTYLSASVQAAVRMSWIQLEDAEFAVDGGDLSALPRDLQRMGALLSEADLSGAVGPYGPEATESADQASIEAEREALRGRFLDVRWTADASGEVESLYVTGQLPVYDDVESVSAIDPADIGGTYGVVASTSHASPDDLRNAGADYPDWALQRYLSLPDTITTRTVDRTRSLTAASDNPYDMAVAIETYLRTYQYDENVEAPPDGADIVDYFLFERQRGYCEYYASAMTVMLRAIGIPARVSVGFYPGDYDQGQGGYLYRQANAHAWVEVFFPGYGWVPFEPTAARPLIADASEAPAEAPPTEQTTPMAVEEPTVEVSTPEATPAASDGTGQPPQPTADPGGGATGWLLLAAGAGVAAAAIGAIGWLLWSAPLRGMAASGSLYARVRRVGGWLGVSPSATATPQEYGRAFAERVPQARPHVDRIVQLYEIDEYGPERAGARWLQSADQAWRAIRRSAPGWLVRWRR